MLNGIETNLENGTESALNSVGSQSQSSIYDSSDSSFEETEPPKPPFTVSVEVHAELDFEPIKFIDTEPLESLDKRHGKSKLMETIEQKRKSDEIFAIEDGIPWKIVSKNIERYRIKDRMSRTKYSSDSDWDDEVPSITRATNKSVENKTVKRFLGQQSQWCRAMKPISNVLKSKNNGLRSNNEIGDNSTIDQENRPIQMEENRENKRKRTSSQSTVVANKIDSKYDDMQAVKRSKLVTLSKSNHSDVFDMPRSGPNYHQSQPTQNRSNSKDDSHSRSQPTYSYSQHFHTKTRVHLRKTSDECNIEISSSVSNKSLCNVG